MRELSRKITKFDIKIQNDLQDTVLLVIKSNPNAMQILKGNISASMTGGGVSGERVRQIDTTATIPVPSSKNYAWTPPSRVYVSAFVKCDAGFGVLFLDAQADKGARYIIEANNQIFRVKDIQTMEMVADTTEEELTRSVESERIRLLEIENEKLQYENAQLVRENENLNIELTLHKERTSEDSLRELQAELALKVQDNDILQNELARKRSFVEDSSDALLRANSNLPQVKILILGDAGVGKTCLLRRFLGLRFMDTETTIQPDVGFKVIASNDSKLRLELWDTAGQTGLREITQICLHGLSGAIIAFDVTDVSSFESLPEWIKMVRESQPRAPIVIVGTKVDLKGRRVSSQMGSSFARRHGAPYYDTSSKEDTNVTASFLQVVSRVPRDLFKIRGRYIVVNEMNTKPKHSWWCCGFIFG